MHDSQSAVEFERDDDRRQIRITAILPMTLEIWAAVLARQIDEGLWDYASLFDVTRTTSFPLFEQLSRMSGDVDELKTEHGLRGPVALVVPSWVLDQSRERLAVYTAHVAYPFEVFADLEAAQRWLDDRLHSPP